MCCQHASGTRSAMKTDKTMVQWCSCMRAWARYIDRQLHLPSVGVRVRGSYQAGRRFGASVRIRASRLTPFFLCTTTCKSTVSLLKTNHCVRYRSHMMYLKIRVTICLLCPCGSTRLWWFNVESPSLVSAITRLLHCYNPKKVMQNSKKGFIVPRERSKSNKNIG